MNITFGCDPEVFFQRDGKPIPAIGMVGGSKDRPRTIAGKRGYTVQEDNVTLEWGIPATNDPEEFVRSNLFMRGVAEGIADANKCVVLPTPSVVFEPEALAAPECWVFGCEPDYNAWKLQTNLPPELTNPVLRSAGGHIHIGFEGNRLKKIELVRSLDVLLGIWMSIAEPENERAKLYGAPGAMRFKKYGVEWRTPSNHWVQDSSLMAVLIEGVSAVTGWVINGNLKGDNVIPDTETFYNRISTPESARNYYHTLRGMIPVSFRAWLEKNDKFKLFLGEENKKKRSSSYKLENASTAKKIDWAALGAEWQQQFDVQPNQVAAIDPNA